MMAEWLQTLVQFLKSLKFLVTVQDWEGAILMRAGRFKRVLDPGVRLKWPLLDRVWDTSLLAGTTDIGPLPLVTRDGYAVTASAVVTWEVGNVHRFLTTCQDPKEVIHDAASGELAHAVLANDWDIIRAEPFIGSVALNVRDTLRQYGIRVLRMRWTGLSQVRPTVLWVVGNQQLPAQVVGAKVDE